MKYDIAIIGAGLVGQALAAALVKDASSDKNHLKIALIDPIPLSEPAPSVSIEDYDLRVSAITPQSQDLLTSIGAWQQIPAQATKAYTQMHVWDAEGTGSVSFDAADLHQPALGHIVENIEIIQMQISGDILTEGLVFKVRYGQ